MAQAASTYLGEQRRRSTRLEQISPLIIRGVDLLGQPFEERTATQNLSFQGCRYASKHHLPKNTWVTLEAPSGDSRNEAVCARARVAWILRPRTLRELFQVGVELERPRNVWNVAFPPADWSSDRPAELSIVRVSNSAGESKLNGELSLEDYLRLAVAVAKPETSALIEHIRQEFSEKSEEMTRNLRMESSELTGDAAGAISTAQASSQGANAKELHEQWLKEFQQEKTSTKREIEAAVSDDVAAQLANFREQMRDLLATEWVQKLSHAQVEFSKWESDAQTLKDEVRTQAESMLRQSDDRVDEKLAEIRQELERSLLLRNAAGTGANLPTPPTQVPHVNFSAELEAAREQWNELIESSIDNAARRFTERVTNSSQEILHRGEQAIASRAMDMQKDAGLTIEASRAAIGDLREDLQRELSEVRSALAQIEQSASEYLEHSRQIEVVRREALDDLRGKLDCAVTDRFSDMERRTVELEVRFSERADLILDQRIHEAVAKNREAIQAWATEALERVKFAAEQVNARDEAAENMLEIHRERLRQFGEQMQREQASRATADLERFDRQLGERRDAAAAEWMRKLEEDTAHARQDALSALASQVERQIGQAAERLRVEADQSLDSTRQLFLSEGNNLSDKLTIQISRIESEQLERTVSRLAAAAQDQEQAARTEFRKAAEAAASALGEMIVESEAKAFAGFSTAIEEKVEHRRQMLTSASEDTLASVQTHAQRSFEHFQEQLAIKSEQVVQKVLGSLTRNLEMKMDNFRSGAEASLEHWQNQLEVFLVQAQEKNQQRMMAASNSMVEAALEQLERRVECRVTAAEKATEHAVQQACASALENMAQNMKEQSREVAQNRSESEIGNVGRAEHQASA